jgi:hypothetical protein
MCADQAVTEDGAKPARFNCARTASTIQHGSPAGTQ